MAKILIIIGFLLILKFSLFQVTLGRATCFGSKTANLTEIKEWLSTVNKTMTKLRQDMALAQWNYLSNFTRDSLRKFRIEAANSGYYYNEYWEKAKCIDCESARCSNTAKRRIAHYYNIDTAALPAEDSTNSAKALSALKTNFAMERVCLPDNGQCLPLVPDLTSIMQESDDYCKLLWAWEGWRNATGRKMRKQHESLIMHLHSAARVNGFRNAKKMWTRQYTNDEEAFFDHIEEAWQKVKPLYRQLHAYTLRKLKAKYGAKHFPDTGHIPAHLLGDMWAQQWDSLYDLLVPYPDAPYVDVTSLMLAKNWNQTAMAQEADRFFQSIGFEPMANEFWNKSIFVRQPSVEMDCHASAYDLYGQTDFRIRMCSEVTSHYFQTVHHEMGHIQYFKQYKDQPFEFRQSANHGFHEAMGDLIALSVMTPGHLKTIGLLPRDFFESEETSLNSLLRMALEKLALLPYSYALEKYRWRIFEGDIALTDLNKEWWKFRCGVQGVSPPIPRSEADFDAGSKYHVASYVPYVRYFFSLVAQFQFHRAICQKIGWTKDFHKCDIYNHTEATKNLRDAMTLGSSIPYPEVMLKLTGTRNLDASALLDYFKPLHTWLKEENKGEPVGWTEHCPTVTPVGCNYELLNEPTNLSVYLANGPYQLLEMVLSIFGDEDN